MIIQVKYVSTFPQYHETCKQFKSTYILKKQPPPRVNNKQTTTKSNKTKTP